MDDRSLPNTRHLSNALGRIGTVALLEREAASAEEFLPQLDDAIARTEQMLVEARERRQTVLDELADIKEALAALRPAVAA